MKSCVAADFPHRPTYADSDAALLAAPDFATRYQLLAGAHFDRVARENALEAAVDACRP